MVKFKKNSDEAIKSKTDDKFGREGFAKGLADALIKVPNNQPFTVGLYGSWGSGKTSIINLAVEHINLKYSDEKVVIIHFNPWVFSSPATLHQAFFIKLAQSLGAKLDGVKDDLAKNLVRYGELTTPIYDVAASAYPAAAFGSVFGRGMKWLGKRMSEPKDLDTVRENVNKILIRENKRVVIIIDDIDRLDSDEIHQVFKLVKNTAHFSNVSYLLSFDQSAVAEALAARYPKNPKFGINFIDKIVQLPLYVPAVDHSLLDNYLLTYVQSVLDSRKAVASDEDVARFQSIYYSNLWKIFNTPRKIVRYVNALDFSIERLHSEVNLTDILLVDIIRLYFPDLYSTISENKRVMIAEGVYSDRDERTKENVKRAIFGDAEPKAHEIRLLQELFPTIEFAFGGSSYASDFQVTWEKERRICTEPYFVRYFAYDIPPGQISDKDISAFLKLLEKPKLTPKEISKSLAVLVKNSSAKEVVSKLRKYEKDLPVVASERLAVAILNIGPKAERYEEAFLGDTLSPYVQSAILSVSLLKKVPSAFEIIQKALKTVSLDYSAELLRWIRVASDEKKDTDRLFSEKQVDTLGALIAVRVKDEGKNTFIQTRYPDAATHLMWIWQKWGNKADILKYLNKHLKADVKNAVEFLGSYVGYSYQMSNGKRNRSDFRREHYNSIAEYVDPEVFVDPLIKHYGKEINTGEFKSIMYDEEKYKSYDQQLAQQFLAMHRAAKQEKIKSQVIEGEIVEDQASK